MKVRDSGMPDEEMCRLFCSGQVLEPLPDEAFAAREAVHTGSIKIRVKLALTFHQHIPLDMFPGFCENN